MFAYENWHHLVRPEHCPLQHFYPKILLYGASPPTRAGLRSTQNAVNSHRNVTGTHKSPTPEPTWNIVNSHRNIAGTHKSPGGAHTGAHLTCCKFSGKRSRSPNSSTRAQQEPTPEPTSNAVNSKGNKAGAQNSPTGKYITFEWGWRVALGCKATHIRSIILYYGFCPKGVCQMGAMSMAYHEQRRHWSQLLPAACCTNS